MSIARSMGELPQFSHTTATFIRDYLPTFRSTFGRFCAQADVTPQLPISTELYAEKLYLAMFSQSTSPHAKVLEQTIREFVTESVNAESVLLKTWMRMINDFVDLLEDTSSSTEKLLELATWVDQLSLGLYHTYFHISKEVVHDPAKWTPELLQKSRDIIASYGEQTTQPVEENQADDKLIEGLCYFRGVEVTMQVAIQDVRKERITCRLDPRVCAVASRADHVLLQSPDAKNLVVAEILACDLKENLVALNHFEEIPKSSNRREEVRVEPYSPVDVDVHHSEGRSRGTVIDISERSVAIYLRNTGVDLSEKLQLAFQIPCKTAESGFMEIQTDALLKTIRTDRRGDPRAHVIVLEFDSDNATRAALAQYVTSRQTEILKEIRHIMEGRA